MVNKNHSQSDKKVINIECACGNDGLANEFSGSHPARTEHLRYCQSGGGLCNIKARSNLTQGSADTHRAEGTRLLGWRCCSFQQGPYIQGFNFGSRMIDHSGVPKQAI